MTGTSIQCRARHLDEYPTRQAVQRHHGTGTEIPDGAALAIAAWWQDPAGTGSVLASLASGCRVDLTELLDDIHATRTWARANGVSNPEEERALDMLATWALNHDSREG